MGPNFAEQAAALQAQFPGTIHLHFEFIRGRKPTGEFCLVVPVLIPVIEFVSEDHLRAVIAAAKALGIASNNPHTCYLDGDPQASAIAAQLALKRAADPKGLLKPGKLKPAGASDAVKQAMPEFLYT